MIFSYLVVLIAALADGEKKLSVRFLQIVWQLAFLGLVRSVLWIWLISRDRVPARISNSMYLMEFCILMGMLLVQLADLQKNKKTSVAFMPKEKFIFLVTGALYMFMGVAILPSSVSKTDRDVLVKAENNVRYDKLYTYLSGDEMRENFYFIDVYSSVAYTEKMFKNVDNSMDNYDIMGGWACKSPIWKKKLAAFGIENMEEALVLQTGVYYVQETGASTRWLYDYYEDQGMEIRLEPAEEPLEEFEIYRVTHETMGE